MSEEITAIFNKSKLSKKRKSIQEIESELHEMVDLGWISRIQEACCCNEASITKPNNENTNESKDEYQPYLINDSIYEMVLNCPSAYNDTFNIFSKD